MDGGPRGGKEDTITSCFCNGGSDLIVATRQAARVERSGRRKGGVPYVAILIIQVGVSDGLCLTLNGK